MNAVPQKSATVPASLTFAVVTMLGLILAGMVALTANQAHYAIHFSQGDAVRDLDRAGFVPVRSSFARAGGKS